MIKFTVIVSIVLLMLITYSCIWGNKKENLKKEINLFSQYGYLLEQSFDFDSKNKLVKYELQAFVDSFTQRKDNMDTPINPFTNNNARGGPTILHPYIFNNKQDKAIFLILTKGRSTDKRPVDKIKYVLGEKASGAWTFELKESHVRSFSYEGDHPMLSDTEMSLRVLGSFIDWGLMPKKSLAVNDDFFDKDW